MSQFFYSYVNSNMDVNSFIWSGEIIHLVISVCLAAGPGCLSVCLLIAVQWMQEIIIFFGLFHLYYCRTANFRVQEIFAIFWRFANISCTLILPKYSRGLKLSVSFYGMKFPARELPMPLIRENFLSRNFPVLQYIKDIVTCVWCYQSPHYIIMLDY